MEDAKLAHQLLTRRAVDEAMPSDADISDNEDDKDDKDDLAERQHAHVEAAATVVSGEDN